MIVATRGRAAETARVIDYLLGQVHPPDAIYAVSAENAAIAGLDTYPLCAALPVSVLISRTAGPTGQRNCGPSAIRRDGARAGCGRISGARPGCSQIPNPVFLVMKNTVPRKTVCLFIGHHTLSNCFHSLLARPAVRPPGGACAETSPLWRNFCRTGVARNASESVAVAGERKVRNETATDARFRLVRSVCEAALMRFTEQWKVEASGTVQGIDQVVGGALFVSRMSVAGPT